MNKYGAKIAACALMGTISVSGYQMTLEAKIHNSIDVPAAGVAVILDDGSTIQDLQVEVVQNIAYLESVSGLQPNIVMATEKVSLAEAPLNVVRAKNTSAKATTELVRDFVDAVDVSGIELETETSTPAEAEEEIPEQETSLLDEDFLTESLPTEVAESLATEFAESLPTETVEELPTEGEFQDSAGFSALETYEDVEIEENVMAEEETEVETEEETDVETEEETEAETEEDAQDFSGLVIARVSNYVNVRSIPSEEGEIVGKLYDKSVGECIEEENGWYKIVSGSCEGYVKGEFCVVGEEAEALAREVGTTYAVVNTTTLKVRQEPNTDSSVLGLVPIEEELVVVEELDGWVKIAIEEGDGYVSREYVNLRTDFVHAESRAEEEARLAKEAKSREEARAAAAATEAARAQQASAASAEAAQKSADNQAAIAAAQSTAAASEGSEMGKEVINYATQFVGNPYVYGGSSLTNGTDCSGFVMSVYANFGVSLPHSSSALRSQGYDVGGLENAQPGDIVCYSGHVGLYVGNGQIVHASTSKTGIIVSSASYRSVLAVRRIF